MTVARRSVFFVLVLVAISVVHVIFFRSEEPWRFNAIFRLSEKEDTWWTVEDALELPQASWRNWLNRNADMLVSSDHFRVGLVRDEDCGFTMHMNYRTFNNNDIRKVFFKFAHAFDPDNHVLAETHLREIKAAYLDRILGTKVVSPCTGYKYNYQDVHDRISGNNTETDRLGLYNNMLCVGRNKTIEGAAMFFVPGVTRTTKQEIISAAREYNSSDDSSLPEGNSTREESAIRYVLFNYLAGCFKSGHNHFIVDNASFIAIDNDRCFTPEHLETAKKRARNPDKLVFMAESLLFDTCCDLPLDVVQRIEEISEQNHSLSDQLRAALQMDVLADALLQEQPKALEEVDVRAHRLWEHIRSCQASAGYGRNRRIKHLKH